MLLVIIVVVVVNICEGQLTCKLLVARFISQLISAANRFEFFRCFLLYFVIAVVVVAFVDFVTCTRMYN